VDRAIVERVAEEQFGAPVTAVRHLPSSVCEVFLVSSGERQMVARFNVVTELDRFRKEAWCIDRAARAGVPGPQVLAVGTEGQYAFMVESYVAGRRGDSLPADAQGTMWRDVGVYLRRIHATPVGGFGEERADLSDDDDNMGWTRYLDYNRSALTPRDPLLELKALDPEQQAVLRHTFDGLARLPVRFGLCHGDPSPWNVIRGDDGVLRLIDWGEAHAHVVPHFDLGVILDGRLDDQTSAFQELLAGYGLDRAGYDAIRAEVFALRLLIATDKVRWAIERKPERLSAKVEILRSLLGERVDGAARDARSRLPEGHAR